MNELEIRQHARQMVEMNGPQAIAIAAQNAARHEEANEMEDAKKWKRIEAALKEIRGPHQG